MAATQSELRLANLIDERELTRAKHEEKLAEIEAREDKSLTESDRQMLTGLRERAANLDVEVKDLADEIKRHNDSIEESKAIRRVLAGTALGDVEADEEGVVYRTMAAYARDVILTHSGRVTAQIQSQLGDKTEIQRAAERLQMLKRTPANTLSSNVGGLIPPQHIAQIFQVIDSSRPLVEAAGNRVGLDRGTVTYPVVTTPPVVAVQSSEKTEAGNTGMQIDMVTKTASTYLGGGDLSWQAINWSTPNALDMWFRLTAADYALKTETDAATVVSASAFLNNIASTIATNADFAATMTAIGAGYNEVYANSGRTANALIMAPDRFGYLLGLTSAALTQFVSVGQAGIGPLRIIVSRGLNAGEMIVGDMDGLLVAETPGAPVELRVVEPAIGGVEVGLIGAFEAAVVDDGAFALISTAS